MRTGEQVGWRPLVGLGALAATFATSFVVVYVVTVRTVRGRLFSDASLRGAILTNSAVSDAVDAVLDVVSVALLAGTLALVATIALVRLDRAHGLAAIGVLVGANVSTWALKEYLLDRPDLGLREVAPATLNSLPSGHTTAVLSSAAALVFVLPRRWRPVILTAGVGLATLVALATMSAGWHRAGDSMAAFLLVGIWTCAAAAAVVLADPAAVAGESVWVAGPLGVRWVGATAAGLLVLGLTLALVIGSLTTVGESDVGAGAAFVAGALLITGTALAVFIGVVAALDLMDPPTETAPGAQS